MLLLSLLWRMVESMMAFGDSLPCQLYHWNSMQIGIYAGGHGSHQVQHALSPATNGRAQKYCSGWRGTHLLATTHSCVCSDHYSFACLPKSCTLCVQGCYACQTAKEFEKTNDVKPPAKVILSCRRQWDFLFQ